METPETELAKVRSLLEDLAKTLTKLHDSGVPVELKFNSVLSDWGYCLQNEDGSWRAAIKAGNPPKWWPKHDRMMPDDH